MAFLDAGKDEKEQVNSAFVNGPDKWKKTRAARLGNLFIFFNCLGYYILRHSRDPAVFYLE